MFRWLRHDRSGRRPDTIDVGRLLRLEATEACIAPSAGLRRRTLAALRDASLQPAAARQRPLAFTYAAACGLLVLLAAAAALHVAAPGRAPAVTGDRSDRAVALNMLSLDTSRLESPLRQEARMLVADARHVREFVLARLPRRGGDG
ncbi:MAG: hypothetical protein ACYSU7_17490 [Planctomycetota bacterium]|jgi:hypothetical protein